MKISIVIPARNEEGNIQATINEIIGIIDPIDKISDFEIVVIDDHSSDATFEKLSLMKDRRIVCLRLSRCSGSHVALRAGLSCAKADVVLCISADGQDDPGCIGKMLEEWTRGKKIVWALRYNRKSENWLIRLTAKLFYKLLLWLVEANDITVDISRADFFLLDRRVVEAINCCPERNTSLFGLIAWLGFSQGYVEYNRRQRKSGHSKWSFRNRMRLAKDWIIAFSGLPLKMVAILGTIVACVGFIYATYVVSNALFISPALGLQNIPGWSSTIAIVLILGGIQMIILGVIGEYLWRNLDETRRRPLYFIEKDINVK